MYSKFIKCLRDLCFNYEEFERVELESGVTAYNVVKVYNNFKYLYFEFAGSYSNDIFAIYVWDGTGHIFQVIKRRQEYLMIFELANIINNM